MCTGFGTHLPCTCSSWSLQTPVYMHNLQQFLQLSAWGADISLHAESEEISLPGMGLFPSETYPCKGKVETCIHAVCSGELLLVRDGKQKLMLWSSYDGIPEDNVDLCLNLVPSAKTLSSSTGKQKLMLILWMRRNLSFAHQWCPSFQYSSVPRDLRKDNSTWKHATYPDSIHPWIESG
jgi:hypothetical protein